MSPILDIIQMTQINKNRYRLLEKPQAVINHDNLYPHSMNISVSVECSFQSTFCRVYQLSYIMSFLLLALLSWKVYFRSSHLRCSVRIGVLRNFAKFTGKHLSQSLFFKKETLAQVFSCEFCETSKNTFFTEHFLATASVIFALDTSSIWLQTDFLRKSGQDTKQKNNFTWTKCLINNVE